MDPETDFRPTFPLEGRYIKAAALQTAVVAVIAFALRSSLSPAEAAAGTARTAMGLLAALTLAALWLGRGKEAPVRERLAAFLVPTAVATVGACFGAAHASENGLYLFAGFMLGVGYGVYGLMRNIDDNVKPSRLLLVTMAQVLALFLVLG